MQKLFTSHLVLEPILHLLVLLPILLFFLKDYKRETFKNVFLFALVYFVYQVILVIPRFFPILDVINSPWNWEGKILAALWAIACAWTWRKRLQPHYFITYKQDANGVKLASLAGLFIVLLATLIWGIYGKSEFDAETLWFQLTLPGIDEEILFRGVLLGLLLNTVAFRDFPLFNPSIWITAILFGFIHGFTLNKNFEIQIDGLLFTQTAFAGWVWAWMTIKSRSILLPILSHNFSNFFGTLISMLK
jgi:membrane protease YdiL (CAAX protease family)